MVFSSTVFLFIFLPAVLIGYTAAPRVLKNLLLLVASMFFYAWGEGFFVVVMVASIATNYGFGLAVDRFQSEWARKCALACAVIVNLGLLVAYKYTNFLIENLNGVLAMFGATPLENAPVHLPIGISFFTFQAMSYVIDVYRRDAHVQRNPFNIALYISLFPQLIAGPIVRYQDVARQINERRVTIDGFSYGVQRFIIGLGKKVLIANTVAVPADAIFGLPTGELTTGLAWLGIVSYTLQIYFDFSGYSDMAIGLGHMFGFRFMENFNYPYISQSITEFWRRWHISLSTWFRDYLYIPIGGNRGGAIRTYVNLVIVFFLCGLWHGASWTFVAWGFFHGAFLVIERMGFGRALQRVPLPVRSTYTLLVVLVGWVFFRAETFAGATAYLAAMFGFAAGDGVHENVAMHLDYLVLVAIIAGAIGSTPIWPKIGASVNSVTGPTLAGLSTVRVAALVSILIACVLQLGASTHNPFIYFRF